jgi:hypothetical protein
MIVPLLSKPYVKTTIIIYVSGVFSFNILGTYVDSKIYLNKYRQGNLNYIERCRITNDWEAILYGSTYNSYLYESLLWPLITPSIVLLLT